MWMQWQMGHPALLPNQLVLWYEFIGQPVPVCSRWNGSGFVSSSGHIHGMYGGTWFLPVMDRVSA